MDTQTTDDFSPTYLMDGGDFGSVRMLHRRTKKEEEERSTQNQRKMIRFCSNRLLRLRDRSLMMMMMVMTTINFRNYSAHKTEAEKIEMEIRIAAPHSTGTNGCACVRVSNAFSGAIIDTLVYPAIDAGVVVVVVIFIAAIVAVWLAVDFSFSEQRASTVGL